MTHVLNKNLINIHEKNYIPQSSDVLDSFQKFNYTTLYLTLKKVSEIPNYTEDDVLQTLKVIVIWHYINFSRYCSGDSLLKYLPTKSIWCDIQKFLDVDIVKFTEILYHPLLIMFLIKNGMSTVQDTSTNLRINLNARNLCPMAITFTNSDSKKYLCYFSIAVSYIKDNKERHIIFLFCCGVTSSITRGNEYPLVIQVSHEDYIKFKEYINTDEIKNKYNFFENLDLYDENKFFN